MAPVAIRYYELTNTGITLNIYPRLVEKGDNVVWDGKYNASVLASGETKIYDLKDFNSDGKLNGKEFYLGSNTVVGAKYIEWSAPFTYDENSNVVASAAWTGTIHDGALTYRGPREKE